MQCAVWSREWSGQWQPAGVPTVLVVPAPPPILCATNPSLGTSSQTYLPQHLFATHFSSANPGSTCPCAVCARSSTVLVTNAMHSNMHNALQKSTLFFTKSDTEESISAYSGAHFWCSEILSIPRDRKGFPSSNGNIQE